MKTNLCCFRNSLLIVSIKFIYIVSFSFHLNTNKFHMIWLHLIYVLNVSRGTK